MHVIKTKLYISHKNKQLSNLLHIVLLFAGIVII